MSFSSLKTISLELGLLLFALFSVSCGGGTAGTSPTEKNIKTIQGAIFEQTGAALEGASVSVEDSAPTVTDSSGQYQLQANVGTQFLMNIGVEGTNIPVSVTDVEEKSTLVTVDAQVNPSDATSNVQFLSSLVQSLNCGSLAEVNGTNVNFTVPSSGLSCNLSYIFQLGGTLNSIGQLVVTASSCSSLLAQTTGNQIDGRRLTLFQELRINKIYRDCTAQVTAQFPGLASAPSFSLRFSPEKLDSQPTFRVTYAGTLSAIKGQSLDACSRFTSDRLPVRYKANGADLSAEFSSENLRISGNINRSEMNDSNRYYLKENIGEEQSVSVNPIQGFGSDQASFIVLYTSQQEGMQCVRGFEGLLSRQ